MTDAEMIEYFTPKPLSLELAHKICKGPYNHPRDSIIYATAILIADLHASLRPPDSNTKDASQPQARAFPNPLPEDLK